MNHDKPYSPVEFNQQTARITWPELERHFARGVVIEVDAGLDLVEVATSFANDEQPVVQEWLAAGQVQPLSTDTARRWNRGDAELWAVVVAPWVLVQERTT
ncbi:MAG: DUF2288 domain-containing protein [Thiogranum sp.]|nr:DUF2288 domain-containing protein [Thiogranum sp.]